MDRRVAALFGGIVAVGLGPAVWLGGTLLRPAPVPAAPTPGGTAEVSSSPTDSVSPGQSTPDPSATLSTFAPPDPGGRFPGRTPAGTTAPAGPVSISSTPVATSSPGQSTSPPPAQPTPTPETWSPSPDPTPTG
jgi:hypothetical protein